MKSSKLNLIVLILFIGLGGQAAELSEFAIGRQYYSDGEFKKAVTHFQLALKASPNDAQSHYWIGMSYQMLADIATPFGGKHNAKARVHLAKAVELAPNRQDYRRELFDFLLDSAVSSRTALPRAMGILQKMPESDPEYGDMRWRLEYESRVNSSAEVRLGRLFLAGPQAAYRTVETPVSLVSSLTRR